MPASLPRSSDRWWLTLLAASALLGAISWLAYVCWRDPGVPFLSERGAAQWIVYPSPFMTAVRPAIVIGGEFRKRFALAALPAEATLSLRALRRCEVRLNGHPVALGEAANWKREARADVAELLREGENQIVATVLNQPGPPALWLTLIHSGGRVVSDADWEVSIAGSSVRAATRRRIDGSRISTGAWGRSMG